MPPSTLAVHAGGAPAWTERHQHPHSPLLAAHCVQCAVVARARRRDGPDVARAGKP